MATRSYDDFAARMRAEWSPDVQDFHGKLAAQLDAEVAERVRLGNQLASLRRSRHLTQAKLAALSSVRQPEISRIERGVGNPTTDTVTRLAAAMGAQLSLVPDDAAQQADVKRAASA